MNNTLPAWVPDLIDTTGKWDDVLARLYSVYCKDIKSGKPPLNGLPVWWDEQLLDGDTHEEGFWHVITRGTSPNRYLDPPRAERLTWLRPTILHAKSQDVLMWDYLEGKGKVRTYLWFLAGDYVAIFEKVIRKTTLVAYVNVTAFVLDGPSNREKMQKKYDKRLP